MTFNYDLLTFDEIFEIYLPIPYRILFLLNFGLFLWIVNLKICIDHNIDPLIVLKIPKSDNNEILENNNNKIINSSNHILLNCSKIEFKKITILNLINYSIFLILINFFKFSIYLSLINLLKFLPIIGIFSFFSILLTPLNSNAFKKRFLETIKRTVRGDIDINLRNNDILLADTLTSYNKILIDFIIYLTSLILNLNILPKFDNNTENESSEKNYNLIKFDKSYSSFYNIDLLIGLLPSLIRLNQCLIEYNSSRRRNKQHLLNAIKYSTAILPVLSNILIRLDFHYGLSLWYLSSFINSLYSFIWDIKMDWNFEMFNNLLIKSVTKNNLRSRLMFNVRFYYYFAILIDFCLRFIWISRILIQQGEFQYSNSPFIVFVLGNLYSLEFGYFTLEFLEIIRRWVWVFIKLETEYIKLIFTVEDIELQQQQQQQQQQFD
ncbi:hypothetical protein BVG19_g359 [[Candida] boidinii]|nr:hypothetical protein BVG19_g359 [[Candida] boidinii]OWB49548.1 hypothetical protein B5S27_g1089 [[Candida] boidinii]OWB81909.1 hypothetical protein B5S33_g529 [[Candida] boidinii]